MKIPVALPAFRTPLSATASAFVLGGLFALGLAGPVFAQTTITVVHNGAFDLALAANWSGSAVPTSSNILEWTSAVTGAATDTASVALSVAGLQIANPGGGVTIGGTKPLTIGANGIDLSAATQSLTISDLIALGASQTWTVAAAQTLAVTNVGTITGSNTNLTVAGAGNVNLVSGFSTGTGSLALNGTGTVTLSGSNTFSGGTTISSGTVVVNNPNAFGFTPPTGDPSVVINGGTLTVGSLNLGYDFSGTGGQIVVGPGANTILGSVGDLGGFNYGGTLVVGAGTALELASAGPATIGNLIVSTGTLSSGSSFPVILPVGGTLTASGTFNISAAFTASQTETASSGSPTYASATIQGPSGASTLTFAGALNGGATLLGNIAITNTYNPDSGHGAQVTANGNIGLGASAITTLNIGGLVPGEFDQTLITGGTYTLNGTLALTFNAVTSSGGIFSATGGQFTPLVGQSFTLYSATTGTLAGAFSSFNLGTLSSNLLAWDTTKLTANGGGIITVDFANDFWTGAAATSTLSWASGSNTNLANFVNTFSGATAVTTGLINISNVFLANAGARNVTTQSMGANFVINSLNFIAGGTTLNGKSTSAANSATLSLVAGDSYQDQNGNNYLAGTGLVMQSGAAASTISATVKIVLDNSQIWENDSANTLTVASFISDGGLPFGLTKTGTGTIVFTSTSSSFSGGTTVVAGLLKMGTTSAVLGNKQGSGALTLVGGAFDLNGSTQTVSGLNLISGTITNSLTTGSIDVLATGSGIVASNTATTTLAATVTGSAGLIKGGSGTLDVLAAELYAGVTNIDGGEVAFASTGSLPAAGTVNVNSGGVLAGTGSVGAVTVASGGALAPGANGTGPGTLTLASGTLQNGSILTLNVNPAGGAAGVAGTLFSQLLVNGTLTNALSGAGQVSVVLEPIGGNLFTGTSNTTWSSIIATGGVVSSFTPSLFSINSSAFAPGVQGLFALLVDGTNLDLSFTGAVAIPEPATMGLLVGVGMMTFVALRRRRSVSSRGR